MNHALNNKETISRIKFDNIIDYLYADYKNCYIIDINGSLYGIGDNTYHQISEEKNIYINIWTEIPLPKNCTSFIKCICGKDYLLCLIKENNGQYKIYSKGNNDKFQCGISNNKLIKNLTKCEFRDNIEIKDIFAEEYFSSAITTDGKLYIWGTININKNGDDLTKKNKEIQIPTLVKVDDDIIIENIAINPKNKNSYLFIIAKSPDKIQNSFMAKKCYFLDIYDEIGLNEIIPWDTKNIPLNVYSNEDGYYILYFNNDKLSHEINNDKNKLISCYKSNDLDKFIQEINSFTDNDIILFIDIIEQIKEKTKKDDIIEDISFNEFIEFMKDKKDYIKLLKLFENNKKYLFDYLRCRSIIISKYFMKYYYTNMLSSYKTFLQPLITKNSLFLTSEARMKFFLSRLDIRGSYKTNYINIDRIKAKSFIEKFNEDPLKIIDYEINITIFGQVFNSLGKLQSKDFFVNKNERLFKVTLLGENAVDQGGPYHEIISEMCKDLQSDYLDLFIKTPNNKNNLGDLRDKYIINPDANKNIHKRAFEFIGKLMITSISSGELLNLNLHPIIFELILNNEITFNDFKTIDYNSYKLIQDLTESYNSNNKDFINKIELNFVMKNSNGTDIELKPNGKDIVVNINNVIEYINLYKQKRLEEFNTQIKEIQKGLFEGISIDTLQILNWRQLEQILCGKKIFDINDFKQHTSYDGYEKDDPIIKWFWEWFENISEEEKFKYLRFVSGRSRLPQTSLGYNYTHKINRVYNQNLYPTSHTCFFNLHLPSYNDKEELIKNMEYVIENSVEINDS